MIITYRNPQDLNDTKEVYFDIPNTSFNNRWKTELKSLLTKNYHLEKNYCFMGFPESPRNVEYLCNEINIAIKQINKFNATGVWVQNGLDDYHILDVFEKDLVMYDESHGVGNAINGDQNSNLGLCMKHDAMNRLHRYFEDLQGEAWGLSLYYKFADYETKYAIRQLNDLCHELESYITSYRKSKFEPEWSQPSQITTWLQAPRKNLLEEDYDLFLDNKFDRVCGGLYLHWAQVGKTHIEVFRDEDGADVDEVVCSTINSLKYYTGEFDIGWAKDITEANAPWHLEEQKQFYQWLSRNGFDPRDKKLANGFIKIGQCNLQKSFGSNDPQEIWKQLAQYLDIYKIEVDGVSNTFDYVWSQDNFKQMQIELMKPGYDYSSKNIDKT